MQARDMTEEERRASLGLAGKRLEDFIVEDETDEPSQITCANGCPKGAQGQHKFSCYWAGTWFFGGLPAKILGESEDQQTVCVETEDGTHQHVDRHEVLVTGKLSRVRYPHVEVRLIGEDGNIFAIIARVSRALRRAGLSDVTAAFRSDVTSSNGYDEALSKVQRWVQVH